jgi:hypothetical protein
VVGPDRANPSTLGVGYVVIDRPGYHNRELSILFGHIAEYLSEIVRPNFRVILHLKDDLSSVIVAPDAFPKPGGGQIGGTDVALLNSAGVGLELYVRESAIKQDLDRAKTPIFELPTAFMAGR